jgi:ribosomal-protein-serine acetyltransferase
MRSFLKIDDATSLHLPRPELALPLFETIDQNRAFLRAWLPWVDGICSAADTKTFMDESMVQNRDGTRLSTFILYGERLVGAIGVVYFNRDHRKCELGYWLREDLQGLGIMSKAAAKFVEYLFKTKGMNRVEAQVLAGNLRSGGLLIGLGFQREGCLKQAVFMYDNYHDTEIYGLVKEDWPKRESF